MHWSGYIAVGASVFLGAWLAFDGSHAFIKGDYVTPKSGAHAGQLGPWSHLVKGVGLDPRSTLFMTVHLVVGLALVAAALFFVVSPKAPAWWSLLIAAILTLWYLPFGTLLSLVTIVVLLLPPVRSTLP
ncbi:MAG: hypothetical protein R3B57_14695 [Phycisphaerales bacterium]